MFIHDITLNERKDDDGFAKRFNYVGSLWAKANEDGITEQEADERLKEFWQAKYCLEQGLPISELPNSEQEAQASVARDGEGS